MARRKASEEAGEDTAGPDEPNSIISDAEIESSSESIENAPRASRSWHRRVWDRQHYLIFLGMAAILIVDVAAPHAFHEKIVDPSSMQGVLQDVVGIFFGVVAGLALVTLGCALFTFFAIEKNADIQRFHEAIGRRAVFALILASFIALRSVAYDALQHDDSNIDFIDVISRITTTITIVAIATCVRLSVVGALAVTRGRMRFGGYIFVGAVILTSIPAGIGIGMLITGGKGWDW